MSNQPYQQLTGEQKVVTFHDDPVNHSGILPSGEGNYIDNNQVLKNDNKWQDTDGALIASNPPTLPNDPEGNPPAVFAPVGKHFNQLANYGSNAYTFPPATFAQGNYIHYVSNPSAGQGLIDKTSAAVTFDPSSTYTLNEGVYQPYG